MKQPWQQQQEQMRRQQEQMRRQQEQMKQQQDQLRHQQQMAAFYQQQQAGGKPAASQVILNDRFSQVEAEVSRLRQERASGSLSDEQFKARLKELMVQDEYNTWWMIGADTGAWYRHEGSNWTQADPRGRMRQPSRASEFHQADPQPYRQKSGHPFRAILFFILGMAGVIFLGSLAARFVPSMIQPDMWGRVRATWEFISGGGVWLIGFVLVLLGADRIWRGR